MYSSDSFRDDGQSFEESVLSDSVIRGRALERIRVAQRDRSKSNLGTSQHSVDSDKDKDRYRAASRDREDSVFDFREFHQGIAGMSESVKSQASLEDEEDFQEDEEEDDQDIQQEQRKDVREALFEAIPEPYYQSTDFQRVIITEPNEPPEEDTKDACKLLKKAMEIREKWLADHPFPPQDISDGFTEQEVTMSPHRKGKDIVYPQDYRRRSVPPYRVFGTPLPETIPDMKFKMVKGVMHVKYVSVKEGVMSKDLPAHAISEEKTPGLIIETGTEDGILAPPPAIGTPGAPPRTLSARIPSIFCTEDECTEVDWTDSLFPVYSYQEFCTDFEQVL